MTYSYTVTAEDVAAGKVLNKVTVTDPLDPTNPVEDEVEVPKHSSTIIVSNPPPSVTDPEPVDDPKIAAKPARALPKTATAYRAPERSHDCIRGITCFVPQVSAFDARGLTVLVCEFFENYKCFFLVQ